MKFFEEQDRLRGGPADELCGESYKAQIAGFPAMDLAGHKQFATAFYGAFPDLTHTIEDVIAEGDRAAVRFRLTGTHSGEFMGAPASGKAVDVGAMVLMDIDSGKVTELRGEFDEAGMLRQMGALPSG